jgi:uncharacterized repeat protein (TIGR03803 family)
LYGATTTGGLTSSGTVYKFSPAMDTVIKLANLSLNELGPYTNLLLVDDTLFYGLSAYANNEAGSIFCFNRMNDTVTNLFQFRISDNGCNLSDGLIQASDGKLFGFTHEGGNYHAGVHFQYNIGTGYLFEDFEFREDLDKAICRVVCWLNLMGGITEMRFTTMMVVPASILFLLLHRIIKLK